MSTGTFIIKSAYGEIGGDSVINEPTPPEISRGRIALNSMIGGWQDIGIRLETNELKDAGDALGEPQSTTMGIIFNLALFLAGPASVGNIKVVSEQLKENAALTYQIIKSAYQQFDIPQKVVSSTTPKGQGNFLGQYSRTFFEEDETLSG